MQAVEEQAQYNSNAMRTAARAGQAADALGPGRGQQSSAGAAAAVTRNSSSGTSHNGPRTEEANGIGSAERERPRSMDRKTARAPEQDELLGLHRCELCQF